MTIFAQQWFCEEDAPSNYVLNAADNDDGYYCTSNELNTYYQDLDGNDLGG